MLLKSAAPALGLTTMTDAASPGRTLPAILVDQAVHVALEEDLGLAGDITTDWIVPATAQGEAMIVAREAGVIAGLDPAETAFAMLDPGADFLRCLGDGGTVRAGDTIARVKGHTRALLTGERTALNFLGRLSGIATLTAAYVAKVAHTDARIACTRKTTPGLRAFEKFAVRCGGGVNHRFGLHDAVLVKDNHIAAAGGIAPALERLLLEREHMVKIEVEVDTLDQLRDALHFPIDAVLLDNMDLATLREAVSMVRSNAKSGVLTEASGGVSLDKAAAIADTGVDLISVGALTHSPRNLDSSLEWVRMD